MRILINHAFGEDEIETLRDLAPGHEVVVATLDFDPLYAAALHRPGHVAREGVAGLVVVVVAIEGQVAEFRQERILQIADSVTRPCRGAGGAVLSGP